LDTRKILLFGVLLLTVVLADTNTTSAWNNGKSFGSTVNNFYGSNMQSNLVSPMTSDSNFTTMDGSKTFNANMTCGESSKSFMTVSYNLGTPQNGVVALVKIDRDLDGTKEYTFTSPYTASAICSNGIAVCNGGNFSGETCTYYKWNYNGNTLSLSQVEQNLISGCTCINDTCGSIAISSKNAVSHRLASAIYGAVSPFSSGYIVSQAETMNGIAEFFGQKTNSCSNYQGTVISTGTSTTIDASPQIVQQSMDSNSSYAALLHTSSNFSQNNPSTTSVVNSTISINSQMRSTVYNQDGTTDFKTKDANGTLINGHLSIPLENLSDEYCQVKWLSTTTTLYTDSTTLQNGDQWQVETRKCTNHICPFQASIGEIVKHPCGNINNFAEATSALSAIKEMADDITCGTL